MDLGISAEVRIVPYSYDEAKKRYLKCPEVVTYLQVASGLCTRVTLGLVSNLVIGTYKPSRAVETFVIVTRLVLTGYEFLENDA